VTLTAVLIAGYGRSGTTALMALLATDPRVAFARRYPFEDRHLTYLSKFCLLAGRRGPSAHVDAVQLLDYYDDRFGPPPWWPPEAAERPLTPSSSAYLRALWQTFSATARLSPGCVSHYAEKVSEWLPPFIGDDLPCRTINLVRDPRDVFLSARDFVHARGAVGFGIGDGVSELDAARHTAHRWLSFAENARAGRDRPDTMTLRYEDMVREPEPTAVRLSTFLGLELVPADASSDYLDSHRTSRDVSMSVGRWRREPLPDNVRACLETQLQDPMVELGYTVPDGTPGPFEIPGHPDRAFNGTVRSAGGTILVSVSTCDFNMELHPRRLRALATDEIWACVQGDAGDHCSIYWRGNRESFSEERSVHVPFRPGRHWQILRFPVGKHPLWRDVIEQLRIDLFNGDVPPGAGGCLRWIRQVT
jgi:hypothetical protein